MIPEGVEQYTGKAEPPHIRDVEKGAIRRYAEAIGNNNPLYLDEEYARTTRYGGIIAPPGFWGWSMKPAASSTGLPQLVADLQAALTEAGFPRILDGGISYEFHIPVRPGDRLTVSPCVKSISQKEGKSGAMMICDLETTYINQNGHLVAKAYQTFIAR